MKYTSSSYAELISQTQNYNYRIIKNEDTLDLNVGVKLVPIIVIVTKIERAVMMNIMERLLISQ